MTKEEYFELKRQIKVEHAKQLKDLARKYALENNPYELGDIVRDHIGKARILGWSICLSSYSVPSLVYHCENLTSKGSTNKREPERDVYQNNILNDERR